MLPMHVSVMSYLHKYMQLKNSTIFPGKMFNLNTQVTLKKSSTSANVLSYTVLLVLGDGDGDVWLSLSELYIHFVMSYCSLSPTGWKKMYPSES